MMTQIKLKTGLIVAAALVLAGFTASPAEAGRRGVAFAADSPAQAVAQDSEAWITDLREAQTAHQLLVVAATEGTQAVVSMHERGADGRWAEILSTPAYIGRNGLGKTAEGDGKTPVGTFHFTSAFGIMPDPGSTRPYKQVDANDYWSGDPRSGYHYNEMVDIRDYPKLNTGASEHIIDYYPEYLYCLNISYNEAGTPGLGSAIFLHCMGKKTYTGGCVAIPSEQMIRVLQNLEHDCVVVIDSMAALKTTHQIGWDPFP